MPFPSSVRVVSRLVVCVQAAAAAADPWAAWGAGAGAGAGAAGGASAGGAGGWGSVSPLLVFSLIGPASCLPHMLVIVAGLPHCCCPSCAIGCSLSCCLLALRSSRCSTLPARRWRAPRAGTAARRAPTCLCTTSPRPTLVRLIPCCSVCLLFFTPPILLRLFAVIRPCLIDWLTVMRSRSSCSRAPSIPHLFSPHAPLVFDRMADSPVCMTSACADADLTALFANFGTVVSANVQRDRVTGQPKGYGASFCH